MAEITNMILNKVNKRTKEIIPATLVFANSQNITLTDENKSQTCGALYNYERDGSGFKFFKWEVASSWKISRFTAVTQERLELLFSDIAGEAFEVVIDRNITITANLTIPENIKLNILPGRKFNVEAGITLTLLTQLYDHFQHIFTGPGTVVIKKGFATPEMFGAIGNGASIDSAAMTKCFTNQEVRLSQKYRIDTAMAVRTGHRIYSDNATILRSVTAGGILSTATSTTEDFKIEGKLTLQGSGIGTGADTAWGIKVLGSRNYEIVGVTFREISGDGLIIEPGGFTLPRGNNGLILNCVSNSCYRGLRVIEGNGGEFISIVNYNATSCNQGAVIRAGNVTLTGGNITDNVRGLYVGGLVGTNGAHGIIQGVNINHNTEWNLWCQNVELGETFTGCHFYANTAAGVKLDNCIGISFTACSFGGILEGDAQGGANYFMGCQFEPSFNRTLVLAKAKFYNCFNRTGGMWAGNEVTPIPSFQDVTGAGTATTTGQIKAQTLSANRVVGAAGLEGKLQIGSTGNLLFSLYDATTATFKGILTLGMDGSLKYGSTVLAATYTP